MKCFCDIPKLIGTQVNACVSYLINKELRPRKKEYRPSVKECTLGYQLLYPLDPLHRSLRHLVLLLPVCVTVTNSWICAL
jgi:hypothetical protein